MKFTFSHQIGFVRFLGGFKIPEPTRLSFVRYVCAPFTLEKNNAHKSGFVAFIWLSNVLRISSFVHYTKINKSVVVFDAVDVVNQTVRPLAGHVKPSQSMGLVHLAFYAYRAVANAFLYATRNCACFNTARGVYAPRKRPRVRIVMDCLAQTTNRYVQGTSPVSLLNIYPKTIKGQV